MQADVGAVGWPDAPAAEGEGDADDLPDGFGTEDGGRGLQPLTQAVVRRPRGRPRKATPPATASSGQSLPLCCAVAGGMGGAGSRWWMVGGSGIGVQDMLHTALTKQCAIPDHVSQHAQRLLGHFLDAVDGWSVAPFKVEADWLGMSRFSMTGNVVLLASTMHEAQRHMWQGFFARLGMLFDSGDFRPVSIVRHTAFDETPTQLRLDESTQSQRCGSQLPALTDSDHGALPPQPKRGRKTLSTTNKPRTAKVLQSDLTISILICSRSGQYVTITAPVPTCLQVLDASTAETTRAALRDAWDVPGLADFTALFPVHVDASVCDRAASNLKWERAVDAAGTETQSNLRTHCMVHRISTVAVAQASLVKTDISRLIGLALAQRAAGMLALLQQCVRLWLRARMRRYRSHPAPVASPEAKHRGAILHRIFPGSDPADAAKLATLAFYLNGDWENAEEIQHYCPDGCCTYTNDMAFVEAASQALTPIHVGRLLKIFPRHRWTGASQCLADAALMFGPHRCMATVGPIWLRCAHSHREPTERDFVVRDLHPQGVGWEGQQDEEYGPEDTGEAQLDAAGPNTRQEDEDWSQFNARMRKSAAALFASAPTPRIMMMLALHRPVADMMHRALKLSGAEWLAGETAKSARGEASARCRLTATPTITRDFFNDVGNLLFNPEDKHWHALGSAQRSLALSSLAFRLIGQAAGACVFLVAFPMDGYPWKLFELLNPQQDVDALRDAVNNERECFLDPFTAKHRQLFPDVGTDDSIATLQAVAATVHTNISHIEARHASIRRLRLAKSTTWTVNLGALSAYFSLLRFCGGLRKPPPPPRSLSNASAISHHIA